MKFTKTQHFDNLKVKMREAIKPGKCKDNYIGLELEIITKVPRDVITWEMAKLGIKVDVTNDSSIEPTRYTPYDAEVRLLVKQSEVATTLPIVINVLKELGSDVNKSCGLHVHLDMRNRKVADCYKKLVDKQTMLAKMVNKRRLTSEYCRLNKAMNYKEATSIKIERRSDNYGGYYNHHTSPPEGHYSAINPAAYKEHKTIEVRLHEGTLDEGKIVNWVNTLVGIIDSEAA